MTCWSSPFPCNQLIRQQLEDADFQNIEFPGPPNSLVVVPSPDEVLRTWIDETCVTSDVLQQLEQGLAKACLIHKTGSHKVLPECQIPNYLENSKKITNKPDSNIAYLLLQNPATIESYLEIDPTYLEQLQQASTTSQSILQRWLSMQSQLQKQQSIQSRFESLLQQQRDQLRRILRLLISLRGSDR